MNKIVIVFLSIILTNATFAHEFEPKKPHKPTSEEIKQFDKMLDDRLHLTDEQKKWIKQNRPKHIKEMERTISKMEDLHKKIKNVYLIGLPKYQADIRTAPYKTELALLKQNAQKQKAQNKKEFESILTQEQRNELEKIKKEHAQKRLSQHSDE